LRINAVRQLLTDHRLAEAKTMLAPMAYEPHASAEWRETSAKMLDSIAAGDSKSALALIDQAMTHAKEDAKKP
jgi:DNA-binding GntR family transcriptional regulator